MSSSTCAIVSEPPARLWRKAAVLGSLWAAFEILWGSLLHNLHVPLAGMVLSSGGVFFLAAGQRLWPERGLAWRTALICAAMKSISPSAVILGPMAGILFEGILVEAAFAVFGRNSVSAAIGGALAVSWTLIQKILNLFVTFGPNFATLYLEACRYAARTLQFTGVNGFHVLGALLVLECGVGMVAALSGWYLITRGKYPRSAPPSEALRTGRPRWLQTARGVSFSIPRLVGFVAVLVTILFLLARLPLWGDILVTVLYGTLALRLYPSLRRRLRRFRLWAELGAVLVFSGFLLGGVVTPGGSWWNGFAAGMAMVCRAGLIIVGFSLASVELRNPRILNWFEQHGLVGLSDALNLAFFTLPEFTSALSEMHSRWREPRQCLSELVGLAGAIIEGERRTPAVFLITGEKGEGKTSFAGLVVEALRGRHLRVGGILAPGYWTDGLRSGFDVVDLTSGERLPLARTNPGTEALETTGRFRFLPPGLDLGRAALDARRLADVDVAVVDEVGPLELRGLGWARSLDEIVGAGPIVLLLVVRTELAEDVCSRWRLTPSGRFAVSSSLVADVVERVGRCAIGKGRMESPRDGVSMPGDSMVLAGPAAQPFRNMDEG